MERDVPARFFAREQAEARRDGWLHQLTAFRCAKGEFVYGEGGCERQRVDSAGSPLAGARSHGSRKSGVAALVLTKV